MGMTARGPHRKSPSPNLWLTLAACSPLWAFRAQQKTRPEQQSHDGNHEDLEQTLDRAHEAPPSGRVYVTYYTLFLFLFVTILKL
jgi:hypothetical protein